MKYLITLLLSLALFACSPEAPEFGQTAQGLGALFLIGGTVVDGGGAYGPPYLPATYKPSIKKLDGEGFFGAPGAGYAFPVKNLTLVLRDASGNTLETVTGLPPTLIYQGSSVTQTVTTSYTTQVKKVRAEAIDANGVLVTLNLDVI